MAMATATAGIIITWCDGQGRLMTLQLITEDDGSVVGYLGNEGLETKTGLPADLTTELSKLAHAITELARTGVPVYLHETIAGQQGRLVVGPNGTMKGLWRDPYNRTSWIDANPTQTAEMERTYAETLELRGRALVIAFRDEHKNWYPATYVRREPDGTHIVDFVGRPVALAVRVERVVPMEAAERQRIVFVQ